MAAGPEINTSHLNILISVFGMARPLKPLTTPVSGDAVKLT